ncbi:two pore calcium channel protein 1-like [Branchiostoma floridae x Branchiostoma belcheri]
MSADEDLDLPFYDDYFGPNKPLALSDIDTASINSIDSAGSESDLIRQRSVRSRVDHARRLWKFNYQEASIYLQEGGNNDKFDTHPHSHKALPAYLLVHQTWFYVMDLAVSLLLLGLALFEPPAFYSIDIAIHGSLELFALVLLGVELGLKMRWLGPKAFATHKRTMIKTVTLVVMFAEAIIVLIRQKSHIRVTRALRPIFLIDSHYCGGVRRTLRQILQSLPPILDMLILLLFFMLIFAILGFYFFSPNKDDPYFHTLEDSFINLFVLLTTANYPDVMMPAYKQSRWSSMFFILYLSLVLYFLMNLLLAVVYDTFLGIEKSKFCKLFLHKREAAERAFRLLVSRRNPSFVSWTHFRGLMNHYRPGKSERDVYLAFKAINTGGDGKISLEEFYRVYEGARFSWKHEAAGAWFEVWKLPRPLFIAAKGIYKLVTHKFFEYFIYLVISVNGCWILADTIIISNDDSKSPADVEVTWNAILFVTIYVVEAFLKIIGLGAWTYFHSGWNVFDFLVTVAGIVGTLGQNFDTGGDLDLTFHYILVLRPLRLLRLFKVKKRYRDVLGTFFALLPRMVSVAVALLIFYFFFSIIGMEAFNGLPLANCCNGTSLADYYRNDSNSPQFYLNNFDDILRSGVTLFELTVVNNWYIIMNGHVAVTTKWTYLYFMLFYIVTMVVLTIIVAFILEAFLFRIQWERKMDESIDDDRIEVSVSISRDEFEIHFPQPWIQQDTITLADSLQTTDTVQFRGVRMRTRDDLSTQMYRDEVKDWLREEAERQEMELRRSDLEAESENLCREDRSNTV